MIANRKVSRYVSEEYTTVVKDMNTYWPYVSDIIIRYSIELAYKQEVINPKMFEMNSLVVFADIRYLLFHLKIVVFRH